MHRSISEIVELVAMVLILTVLTSQGLYFTITAYKDLTSDPQGGIRDKTATVAKGYIDESHDDSLTYKDVLLMTQIQDDTLPQHKTYSIGSNVYVVDYDYKFGFNAHWTSAYQFFRGLDSYENKRFRFIYNPDLDRYVLMEEVRS